MPSLRRSPNCHSRRLPVGRTTRMNLWLSGLARRGGHPGYGLAFSLRCSRTGLPFVAVGLSIDFHRTTRGHGRLTLSDFFSSPRRSIPGSIGPRSRLDLQHSFARPVRVPSIRLVQKSPRKVAKRLGNIGELVRTRAARFPAVTQTEDQVLHFAHVPIEVEGTRRRSSKAGSNRSLIRAFGPKPDPPHASSLAEITLELPVLAPCKTDHFDQCWTPVADRIRGRQINRRP